MLQSSLLLQVFLDLTSSISFSKLICYIFPILHYIYLTIFCMCLFVEFYMKSTEKTKIVFKIVSPSYNKNDISIC